MATNLYRSTPEEVRFLKQLLGSAVMVMQKLSDRMTEIHDDPAYQSVWIVNQMHTGQYRGPTYIAELSELRKTLAAIAKATGEDK